MKVFFALAMGFLLSTAGNSAFARDGDVKEQIVGINDAFIPSGFDSSSDAFVVVSGIFPNGCYKFDNAKVDHRDAMSHDVTVTAKLTQGLCLMVLVPFSHEVQLGKLAAGEHSIRFLSSDGTFWEKKFMVAE